MESLREFFQPESVVVIGASRDPQKLGYGVARNVIGGGYPGEIFLVNPKGGELFDHQLLASVDSLPDGIDLGLIVVPPKFVPDSLVACSQKNIKNFIILTGGFSEIGPEGLAIEEEVRGVIQSEGLRVIGPNCIGILDTQLPLDTTFIQPPMPQPGKVAFITHSGALGAAMIDWSKEQGFGFSRVLSLGNQIDITETDMIIPASEKDDTRVIAMYLEAVSDGRRFVYAASRAAKNKPVIALKVGRSDAGQKAAASHTGAMAGSDTAYNAAFRRAGVLRANSTEEMFSWAKLFSSTGLPEGDRVAILTNAGGPGVTAADAVVANELRMAVLSEGTLTKLKDILPQAASVANPVDMLASASPQVYAGCLSIILEDPGVEMVLVIAPPPPMFTAEEMAEALVLEIARSEKPVVVSFMGSQLVRDGVQILRSNRIPEYPFPEDGISALAASWKYVQMKQRNVEVFDHALSAAQMDKAATMMSSLEGAGGFASPELVDQIMEIYDLPVLHLQYADNPESAADIADRLAYPVAMKLSIPGISHKSDLGGVLLGLNSREEVIQGFESLREDIRANETLRDKPFGVHLQQMAPRGQEVIVGAVRDPVFGPMVMFGSGGTEVEGLGDVAFALGPLTAADLDYLFEATWAGKKLEGFRQHLPGDVTAVKDVLIKLSQLLIDHSEIQEIEINPLIVLPTGQGCRVVDARLVLESSKSDSEMVK